MKALTYEKYGKPENLSFSELTRPEPGENDILVRVKAVSLNAYDWHLLTADILFVRFASGLLKPKVHILGADVAGVVEKTGSAVTGFKPGDEVFGSLAMSGTGGLAEFAAAPASRFSLKPEELSFDEAAALPMASITALQALRDRGKVSAGKKVLINGAAGGVGTFAIQIAKAYGAEVTAVCSGKNHEQAKALGADFVIDYKKEDFTKNGKTYDIILGVNGYHPIEDYARSLTETGSYVAIGGTSKQMSEAMMKGKRLSKKGGKTLGSFISQPKSGDSEEILGLIHDKNLRPVIDRKFPFSQTLDAFRYLGDGHAKGKIIVSLN